MTIIRSKSGYIAIDPFLSAECSTAVWQGLVLRHLGDKPIAAMIYTHSHSDHCGGVRGIGSQMAASKVARDQDFPDIHYNHPGASSVAFAGPSQRDVRFHTKELSILLVIFLQPELLRLFVILEQFSVPAPANRDSQRFRRMF
jgi:glyoxylase-like metal-dependent hydrolase (beta-lactamase superfamily II)